jgi:hypothetical protein
MCQAAQHGDPLAHRVRPGGEPLVRQRLPAGEAGDHVRREEGAERGGQVVGLTCGRGHREHEPARTASAGRAGGKRRDKQRPQRGRGDYVTHAAWKVRVAGERGR